MSLTEVALLCSLAHDLIKILEKNKMSTAQVRDIFLHSFRVKIYPISCFPMEDYFKGKYFPSRISLSDEGSPLRSN